MNIALLILCNLAIALIVGAKRIELHNEVSIITKYAFSTAQIALDTYSLLDVVHC